MVKTLSVVNHTPPSLLLPNSSALIYKYKKVDQKVRPIPSTLPKDFCNIRCIPVDPILSLLPLLMHLPDFSPGECLSQEQLDELALNKHNFLWLEELKLLYHVLKINELGLAWMEVEKGWFRDEYFSPIKILVIEHIPWAQKNIPILSGILNEVIQIFKDKYMAGVYKHSNASYRSHWFCIEKKSGALYMTYNRSTPSPFAILGCHLSLTK